MRASGVLLTVLALVLVQAPWVVCSCEDDAGCGPLFAECECIGHHAAHRDEAHKDEAHKNHASHEHGAECNHEGGDEPEEPCDHVGFRLPLGTMPAPASLDVALHVMHGALDLALVYESPAALADTTCVRAPSDPPEGPRIAPSVATERLLL